MKRNILYLAGSTAALEAARVQLDRRGCRIVGQPCKEVTHLLLPVPSFDEAGQIKGGGCLDALLPLLPENVTILGGNLTGPELCGYHTVDLLKHPGYVAKNAAITAHCAIKQAMALLPVTLEECPVLVVGWGRIGKCLARLLRALDAEVTVAARKEADRAMLQALGYQTDPLNQLHRTLDRFRLIFNTVPAPVISAEAAALCRADCIKIDLASSQGIAGSDVIWARGLPSKDTPESSGALIAQTVLNILAGKE